MSGRSRRRRPGGKLLASEKRRKWYFFQTFLLATAFAVMAYIRYFRRFRSDLNLNSMPPLPLNQEALEETLGDVFLAPNSNSIKDFACPFRNSSIYRSIYVYPNHRDVNGGWNGDILSEYGKSGLSIPWPWIEIDKRLKAQGRGHYDVNDRQIQYSTELLVRDIITHPDSCLRTNDPETATLFYVPYLPSIEFHNGSLFRSNYSTSVHGKAVMEAIEGNYDGWEKVFGLTSKYWKRRQGSDHILVFSEPMHGLVHPRIRRGNFHMIVSQKQLSPPIVISVGLSTTFVEMYPKCARKNILMPYPNPDGRWFNGAADREAETLLQRAGFVDVTKSPAALPAEKELAKASDSNARPLAQFYSAGNHGTCMELRKAMNKDYKCSPSSAAASKISTKYTYGYRIATFCPCPGGDSPAAKRMFDAIFAGCIPVVLSHDFVWPMTNEFDASIPMDPSQFSIRMPASYFEKSRLRKDCSLKNSSYPGLEAKLASISPKELRRLRSGVRKMANVYAYFRRNNNLPTNPIRARILPNGGAAHALVKALGERAGGVRWPACEEEVKMAPEDHVDAFKC